MLIPTLQTKAGSSKTYTLASYYGITDAFVEQNWTFAANAVYVSDLPMARPRKRSRFEPRSSAWRVQRRSPSIWAGPGRLPARMPAKPRCSSSTV